MVERMIDLAGHMQEHAMRGTPWLAKASGRLRCNQFERDRLSGRNRSQLRQR